MTQYDPCVFYIFVNTDLEMSKGQWMAQVSHITQIITEELVKNSYEIFPPSEECIMYMKWKLKPTTVILRANTQQLEELIIKGGIYFRDTGNRIPDDSLTVVGFFPTNTMNNLVKDYKLF